MPQIRFRDATNALRTLTRCRMRDSSGVLRTIQQIRMRDASNVLRTVWTYLTVVLSHTAINKIGSGAAASGLVTTAAVSSVVTGGTAPFTYAWTRLSGDPDISISSPAASSTTFSATCFDGITFQGVFRLTVTDANGATAVDEVTATLRWVNTS